MNKKLILYTSLYSVSNAKIYASCWGNCVWKISQSQSIFYSEFGHCKIMTKFFDGAQSTSGEPDKPYMPEVPSPSYQSGSIKTAAAKQLWKSDPRLFELGIQKPRDPKLMTVFSNLPEVMEQNSGRTRSVSQFPAAQIAAVATVTSSLLRKAMLNVSSLSTKPGVRALCTHRQRELTSPVPCIWLLIIFNNLLSVLEFRASQRMCYMQLPRVPWSPWFLSVSILSGQNPWTPGSPLIARWIEKLGSPRSYNHSIHMSFLNAFTMREHLFSSH